MLNQDKLKLNWRDSMLNKEQLEEVFTELENSSVEWFFKKLSTGFNAMDLLDLPTNYIQKISDFVSSHDFEYLKELDLRDFAEQATGVDLSKIAKMIQVAKKKQSLEQDFK